MIKMAFPKFANQGVICPKCGTKNGLGIRECIKCGHIIIDYSPKGFNGFAEFEQISPYENDW